MVFLHFFSVFFVSPQKSGQNSEIFGLNWEKIILN